MLTTPITTPHFHSRVLSLVAAHSAALINPEDDSAPRSEAPAPIIPPLDPFDTPLTPGDTVSQLIAYSSPWIDLCSPDPLISNISRQVLTLEVAYASFCGVGNIIIPGPRLQYEGRASSDGLVQYARAVQEALTVGSYVQMAIHMPMVDSEETRPKGEMGDLAPFAREQYLAETNSKTKEKEKEQVDTFGAWDAWHLIRSICKYNTRLSVGKIRMQTVFRVFLSRLLL